MALVICVCLVASQAWAAFGYYSPISINSAQVPSTQTDFPVLVSVTDARFKTVGNSGHVQNSSGFDIRPYTDSTLTTAITGYELERYNASTGEVVMWVKVSSLSSSTTPIYLAYGDSGISTDGSSTTTWSNNYLGVYHLADGTTLNVNSATGSNNGTNHGATATTGQVDGAGNFVSASTQYIDAGNGMNPLATTLSAWVNAPSLANSYNTVICRNVSGGNAFFRVKSNGKIQCGCIVGGGTQLIYDGTGTHTLSTSTWYYLTFLYDNTQHMLMYVNAAVDNTAQGTGSVDLTTNAGSTYIAHDPLNAGVLWNGKFDQVTVSSVGRSPDWITTEYNNQSAPGTFETLGSEATPTAANNGWFYFFP